MTKSRLLASLSMLALCAAPAYAQEAAQLEEVIVTAQKRAENIQDVPISISAVTAAAAAQSGVRTSNDLMMAVPGISITRTTSATTIYIRGIGTQGGQTGLEGAVATFIDGIYMPSIAGSTLALNNIERIEVLKGPQGTLFGRNATGGALNIVTRNPSQDSALEASIGYGNHETVEGSFYGTTGLGDNAAIDLAAYYNNQAEGFGKQQNLGGTVNKQKDAAIRSKLAADLGDDTRLTVAGDYSYYRSSIGIAYRAIRSSKALNGVNGYNGGYWDSTSDFHPDMKTEMWGGYARLEHDVNDALTLVSLTGLRKLKGFQRVDVDGTSLPFIDAPLYYHNEQFTQEFQANFQTDRLNAIAGFFYLDGKDAYDPFQIYGLAVGGGGAHTLDFNKQKTKSIAVFGQATYEIMPDTNLTIGARYTRDRRSIDSRTNFVLGDGTVIPGVQRRPELDAANTVNPSASTFKKPTWRIALDHKFTPDVMGYVSYSRGFKSGLYNLVAPADPAVNPETLDAYEVGLKNNLMDNRLRLNAAAFFYKYDNIQLTLVKGTFTQLFNAAKAEVYGLDADFDAILSDHFSIRGGVSLLHHRYKEFLAAPVLSPNPTGPGNVAAVCPAVPTPGNPCDVSGNRIVRVPDITANLAFNHQTPMAGGKLASNVSFLYNDGFFWAANNRTRQESYVLANAQVMWSAGDDSYNIRVWGRNLTNKKYLLSVDENNTGDIGVPAPGRTFGVSVGVKY